MFLYLLELFGVAVFAISGAQIAEQQALPGLIVVLMAVIFLGWHMPQDKPHA